MGKSGILVTSDYDRFLGGGQKTPRLHPSSSIKSEFLGVSGYEISLRVFSHTTAYPVAISYTFSERSQDAYTERGPETSSLVENFG